MMPQPKINAFFNHNLTEAMDPVSSQSMSLSQNHFGNKHSKKSAIGNQMYNDPIQTILRYKNSRRERHHEKLNEKIVLNQNSERSNESQLSSQMLDDSQNFFMENSSQSQDSPGWNTKKMGSNFQQRPRFRPYSKQTYVKQENFSFRHYTDSARQQAKENNDKEMLHNFLLSAKQCCEQANDIASKMKESMDHSSADVILKVTECLEDKVPKLLEKLLDEKNEILNKLTEIQKEFKHMLQVNGEESSRHNDKVLDALNDTSHLTKQSLQKMLMRTNEIMSSLNKPICHEMSSQYSPQGINNYNNNNNNVALPPKNYSRPITCYNPKESPVATVPPFSFNQTGNIGIQTRRSTRTKPQLTNNKTTRRYVSNQSPSIQKGFNFNTGNSGCYNLQSNPQQHTRNFTNEIKKEQINLTGKNCLYQDSSDDDQCEVYTFNDDCELLFA